MSYRSHRRSGFTLIELMISLGIALLLIYGINLVFRMVTDLVRAGNALSVATRKMRSVDSALIIDFEGTYTDLNPVTNAVVTPSGKAIEKRWSGICPIIGDINPDAGAPFYAEQPRQPAITLFCHRQTAFLNKADYDSDLDKDPVTIDEDETGTEAGLSAARLLLAGGRSHRLDTIGFFAGGTYAPRALRGSVASSTTGSAPQAWVWYGHTLQYNAAGDPVVANVNDLKPYDPTVAGPNNGKFRQPGDGPADNPLNFYATDWVLGRMAVALIPRTGATPIFPGVPTLGAPIGRPVFQFWGQSTNSLTAIDSRAGITAGIGESRVTATSVYSDAGDDAVPDDGPALTGGVPFNSALGDVAGIWKGAAANEAVLPTGSVGTLQTDVYDPTKFDGLLRKYFKLQNDGATKPNWWFRSLAQATGDSTLANPVPLRFNTVNAFTKPVLKQGLLGPNEKSALQATYLAKGCTQFIVEFAGDFGDSGSTLNPDGVLDYNIVNGAHETRWYGLPRDIDGDGAADVNTVKSYYPSGTPKFEKVSTADSYVVAFGPEDMYEINKRPGETNRPWLIRITVTLADSNNNLPSGMTREFIFKVR